MPWPEQNNFYFAACYVCLEYEEILIQKLIKYFKYNYLENLSTILVSILNRQLQKMALPNNTIITNIPLHIKKKRQRGFDQTEILAKQLATKSSLVYYPLLKRIRKTKTQAQLSKLQREKNVAGVFESNKKIVEKLSTQQLNVVLIDDIATTGSTLNQAAKILKQTGFNKIICLVLAKN